MKSDERALHLLTAEDLMSQDVILLPGDMSLRGAAHLLMRSQVSGAPVVDESGRCVGVLSTSDFLKLVAGMSERAHYEGCVCSDWQVVDLSTIPEDSVLRYMTPDPVTVPAELPLPELARRMLNAHIHRVIVVDEVNRPVGIVSSTDVLAAVAQIPTLWKKSLFEIIATRWKQEHGCQNTCSLR